MQDSFCNMPRWQGVVVVGHSAMLSSSEPVAFIYAHDSRAVRARAVRGLVPEGPPAVDLVGRADSALAGGPRAPRTPARGGDHPPWAHVREDGPGVRGAGRPHSGTVPRSEEHTSELQ